MLQSIMQSADSGLRITEQGGTNEAVQLCTSLTATLQLIGSSPCRASARENCCFGPPAIALTTGSQGPG